MAAVQYAIGDIAQQFYSDNHQDKPYYMGYKRYYIKRRSCIVFDFDKSFKLKIITTALF